MRRIERTSAFKKDFRRAKAGRYKHLEEELAKLLTLLVNDVALPQRYRDHALGGRLSGLRDCHLRPDLVLLYEKPREILRLVRLGSHSELFGK